MADGKGCKCAAYSSSDCGCPDVDWTPQEVYDLQAKCAEKDALLRLSLIVVESQIDRFGGLGVPELQNLSSRIRESLGGGNG